MDVFLGTTACQENLCRGRLPGHHSLPGESLPWTSSWTPQPARRISAVDTCARRHKLMYRSEQDLDSTCPNLRRVSYVNISDGQWCNPWKLAVAYPSCHVTPVKGRMPYDAGKTGYRYQPLQAVADESRSLLHQALHSSRKGRKIRHIRVSNLL